MDATQQTFLSDDVDLTAEEPQAQAQVTCKRKSKSKRGDEQGFFESFFECDLCRDTGKIPNTWQFCECSAGRAAERKKLETDVRFLTAFETAIRGRARAAHVDLDSGDGWLEKLARPGSLVARLLSR